jgi:hypothetical protein
MNNIPLIKLILLPFTLLLFSNFCSFGYNTKVEFRSNYNQKDSIQSIITNGEDFNDDGSFSLWSDKYDFQYDDNGNKVESKYYYPEKKLQRVLTSDYNEQGYLKSTKIIEVDGDTITSNYDNDNEGNQIKEVSYTNGVLSYRVSNEFNSHGHKIKSTWFDDIGSIGTETFSYKYDVDDNIIEMQSFNSSDQLENTRVYQYENGKVVREHRYNSDSELIYKKVEKYDSDGNNIESNFYDYIEGNIVKKITAIIEYDDKGNGLKMEQYVNDILKSKQNREIKYFK